MINDNNNVAVAKLETISLALLLAHDAAEGQRLLEAARSQGFFYLNFQNESSATKLLADLPDIYAVTDRYFDQPYEEKVKDFRQNQEASQDRG